MSNLSNNFLSSGISNIKRFLISHFEGLIMLTVVLVIPDFKIFWYIKNIISALIKHMKQLSLHLPVLTSHNFTVPSSDDVITNLLLNCKHVTADWCFIGPENKQFYLYIFSCIYFLMKRGLLEGESRMRFDMWT